MTPTLLIIIGVAGLALVFVLAAAILHRRTRTRREPETRPPLLLRLVRRLVRTVRSGGHPDGITRLLEYQPPARTAPVPVAHTGATEEFGAELHALRDTQVCAELETEVEAIGRYHAHFDQMMADFRHDLDHIADGVCRRLDPYWERVDCATGEWDVAGLRALLDAEDLVGAR